MLIKMNKKADSAQCHVEQTHSKKPRESDGIFTWKEYRLGDVTSKIGSGATPTGGGNSYKTSGITFIRSQNVEDFHFSLGGLAFIDKGQADCLKNVSVEKNDILMNITGESVTRCCIAPEEYLPARVNQHVAIIRPTSKDADYRYVFYYLHSIKPELNSIAEIGCTRRALTKEMLENLVIPLPTISEQRAIAAVLSSLDDKIDLLHRQNKTLEGLASALWRKMFIEEAAPNWKVGRLGDYGQIVCGKTPSKKVAEYFGGKIPFIKIPDMHGNVFLFETEDSLTEKGAQSQQNKTIPAKSICVSCIATVGLVGMNAFASQTNQQINTIVPNKDFYRYFLFLLMRNMTDDLFARASGGTATDNLNTGDFARIGISIPPEGAIQKFDDLVKNYFDKIYLNQAQILKLVHLRDTTLPKLMSGDVRVKI